MFAYLDFEKMTIGEKIKLFLIKLYAIFLALILINMFSQFVVELPSFACVVFAYVPELIISQVIYAFAKKLESKFK